MDTDTECYDENEAIDFFENADFKLQNFLQMYCDFIEFLEQYSNPKQFFISPLNSISVAIH